jgi:hypothetical protein
MEDGTDFEESEWALLADRDGDGIPDGREEAGFTLRFPDGTERLVHSNASVNDTDSDGLSDYEEWYPGTDGFVTDPWNNDTDADGLLDIAEGFSKVQEYGKRERIADQTEGYFYFYASFGPNLRNITVTYGATTGENHAADFIAIVSYQGNVVLENSTSRATYYFNASDVTEKTSGQANGLWELRITPDGSDALLELFKVEAAVQVHPLKADMDGDGLLDGAEMNGTNGWITDPTLLDTDGDSWNDTREIEVENTNPLERDSDGDGVQDPTDKDPVRNVVVKVAVDWAQWGDAYFLDLDINSPYPELAVVTTVDGLSIATTKQTANVTDGVVTRAVVGYYWGVVNTYGKFWPWEWYWDWIPYNVFEWSIGTKASFDTTGDGASDFFYFYDIPDDRSTVTIGTQLWQIFAFTERTGEQRMTSTGNYDVVGINHTAPVEIVVGNNRVHYTATTIGLDKVNTIAVYENETTFVNDHYNTISQQNLVFLDVTGDFTDDVFMPGMNVIVIPTDIFADTKLHKIIELSIDSEGHLNISLLPDYLQAATFSGIDRTRQSISRHVESVINATVSLANATAILDLILTLASNESITDAFRAKRVNACRLGVAADVLALIAWDGAIMRTQTSSGPMPGTWYGNLWEGLVEVFTLIWGGLVAIWNLFAQLFTALFNWGMQVVGEFAARAMAAIELLVKGLVLVALYLLFAINFLLALAMFLAAVILLGSLSLTSDPENTELEIGSIFARLHTPTLEVLYEMKIESILVPWLELNVPDILIEIDMNGTRFYSKYLGIGNYLVPAQDAIQETSVTTPLFANSPSGSSRSMELSIQPSQSSLCVVEQIENPFLTRFSPDNSTIHIPTDYTNNESSTNSSLTFRASVEINDISISFSNITLNISNDTFSQQYPMTPENLTDINFADGKTFSTTVNFNIWAFPSNSTERLWGLNLTYYYNASFVGHSSEILNISSGIPFRLRIFENAPPIFYNPNVDCSEDLLLVWGENHQIFIFSSLLVDLEGDIPDLPGVFSGGSDTDSIQLLLYDNESISTNTGYLRAISTFNIANVDISKLRNTGIELRLNSTLPIGESYWTLTYGDEENDVGKGREVAWLSGKSTSFFKNETGELLPHKLEQAPLISYDWAITTREMVDMMIWLAIMMFFMLGASILPEDPAYFKAVKVALLVSGLVIGLIGVLYRFTETLKKGFSPSYTDEGENYSILSSLLGLGMIGLTAGIMLFSNSPSDILLIIIKIVVFIIGLIGRNYTPSQSLSQRIFEWIGLIASMALLDTAVDTISASKGKLSVVGGIFDVCYQIAGGIFYTIGIISVALFAGKILAAATNR